MATSLAASQGWGVQEEWILFSVSFAEEQLCEGEHSDQMTGNAYKTLWARGILHRALYILPVSVNMCFIWVRFWIAENCSNVSGCIWLQ